MAKLGNTTVFGDLTSNRSFVTDGFFDGHLTNTQTNAENGIYVNIADSVNINRGFTVNSSSSININYAGTYRIEYNVNFHRTGSNLRNVMYAEVELNGSNLDPRTRGTCYIRTVSSGDEGDARNSTIIDLSANDTIRVYANEERGGETGNDIERGTLSIEQIG